MTRRLVIPMLIIAALLGGCDNSAEKRLVELEMRVVKLETANQELRQQLEAVTAERNVLRNQLDRMRGGSSEQFKLVPRVEKIEVSSYSGLREGTPQLTDSPTTQAAAGLFARVYIVATDQDGFRIRPAGRLKIAIFDLSGDQPRSLGSYDFPPADALHHYRAAVGKGQFAVDLPLTDRPGGDVTVRIELHDLFTGKIFTAQGLLKRP
jgi:uncharacterized coiled-coil protein SlyX